VNRGVMAEGTSLGGRFFMSKIDLYL
jgi:hypothetical protein